MVSWSVVGQDIVIVATLLALEAVLSFDNAAALAALVRRLPVEDRRKALLYGLGGAYLLRFSAIALAAFLIRTPILKVIGGGYLVYVATHHVWDMARHKEVHGHAPGAKLGFLARLGLPPLIAIIIQIELLDLTFAIDQIIVAVAFTEKIWLIIIAAGIGILFLRLAAAVMARIMDWLPLLEHMAFIAVGVVGIKLILLYWHIHIPTVFSISITLSLFGIPILLKLVFDVPKTGGTEHRVLMDSGTKD